MIRFGIIGGTFDPPHIGHLIISQEAVTELGLEKVIFVPAGQPLFKGRKVTGASLRRDMLNLAISSNPLFSSSTVELDRPGPSYTIDTLKILKKEQGNKAEVYLIMGMDSFFDLTRWKSPEEIVQLCHIAVAVRPGYYRSKISGLEKSLPSLKGRFTLVKAPYIEISSTDIRRRVKEGVPIKYLVPEPVEKYILEKGLYRGR